MQNAKDLDPKKTNGPMPGPDLQVTQAFVLPVPLVSQMLELIRGNVCHRDADPIIQQLTQHQPQEVTIRND